VLVFVHRTVRMRVLMGMHVGMGMLVLLVRHPYASFRSFRNLRLSNVAINVGLSNPFHSSTPGTHRTAAPLSAQMLRGKNPL
jgi:hypothetical protein